nr:S-layer homology domain-containing protein [Papillibacter cinnamivorans]
MRSGKVRWIQKSKNGSAETIATFGKAEEAESGQPDGAADTEPEGGRPSSWAEEGAEWATEEKLILGDENGNLRWQESLTREQFAVILKRYHDSFGD